MSTHSRETIAKNRAKMKHFLRKKNCCLSPPCSARFSQLVGGRDRFGLQWRVTGDVPPLLCISLRPLHVVSKSAFKVWRKDITFGALLEVLYPTPPAPFDFSVLLGPTMWRP